MAVVKTPAELNAINHLPPAFWPAAYIAAMLVSAVYFGWLAWRLKKGAAARLVFWRALAWIFGTVLLAASILPVLWVVDFLAFSEHNPSSIRACIEVARHNARSVRTALTTEMWETINTAWLEVQRFDTAGVDPLTLVRLIETVKLALLAFDGAAHRTQLREATYWFMRLGTSIERAVMSFRMV